MECWSRHIIGEYGHGIECWVNFEIGDENVKVRFSNEKNADEHIIPRTFYEKIAKPAP
jgi:hypothetical protein